jgi:glutamine synthetase
MALITNPLVNSYKRLVPGYEAPTELTWTVYNQNSLIRIPSCRGANTKIELRSPDASANPYLVLAVCLAAGMDGIRNKMYPTKSSNRSFSESDTKAMNIENLPDNLKEAIELFEQSQWIKEILGAEFCEEYVAAKKKEWLKYSRQITAWEVEEYLYRI